VALEAGGHPGGFLGHTATPRCEAVVVRYRRYYPTQMPDGSVRVISTGPFVALGNWLRLPVALVFIGASIAAMVQGEWSVAGFSLLIGALILPNYAKRSKARKGSE
jgi:hypothetical protein